MAQIKTKYITPDDINENFPELHFSESIGNKAEELALINRVERRVATFLDANFYRKVDKEYPQLTDYQKDHYRYALMEQVAYMFKNGDISLDSGYDAEHGVKATRPQIKDVIICENAKEELMLCGMWCRKIKGRGRNSWWLW